MPEIETVNRVFNEFASQCDLPKSLKNKINIVFDELLTNTISYGYTNSKQHAINVNIEITSNLLTITIADDGVPFDPFKVDAPDTTLGIDERDIGGLGIHLVRNIMDKICL